MNGALPPPEGGSEREKTGDDFFVETSKSGRTGEKGAGGRALRGAPLASARGPAAHKTYERAGAS